MRKGSSPTRRTAHVVVASSTTRENFYVAMTRGREANTAYVAVGQPDVAHVGPNPDNNGDSTARSILYGVAGVSPASPTELLQIALMPAPFRYPEGECNGTPTLYARLSSGMADAILYQDVSMYDIGPVCIHMLQLSVWPTKALRSASPAS